MPLEDVFNLFPNNWMEIKERLETMEEDYIQYERYETLCDQAGVEDEESQSTLISFLHKLGIVVQTHQYAYEKIWWRSGVVLQWQGNRALIKSDKEESIISIWVDGAPATRRDFLYALRLTFDSIYRTIPGLSVTHAEESLNMAAIAYCTATLIFFE